MLAYTFSMVRRLHHCLNLQAGIASRKFPSLVFLLYILPASLLPLTFETCSLRLVKCHRNCLLLENNQAQLITYDGSHSFRLEIVLFVRINEIYTACSRNT